MIPQIQPVQSTQLRDETIKRLCDHAMAGNRKRATFYAIALNFLYPPTKETPKLLLAAIPYFFRKAS